MDTRVRCWMLLALFLNCLIVPAGSQDTDLSRREVMAKLLDSSNYDANVVPDFDKEVPTNVSIQLIIHDIHSISETAMEYSIDVYLRMLWIDERLDYSNFSTKPKLELDTKNIDHVWQPDVFFENEKKATIHSVTTPNKLMHIHRNGTVVYSIRIAMTLACSMKLHYYPFDKQRCPLYIQSYGYTQENIDLLWHDISPVKLSPNLEMPKFDLIGDIKTSDYSVDVSSTGSFSTLKLEMDLIRSVGFYFLQVFIPSIMLVFLSWVSFWVDPNAVPARVSLGVTCVLTMTTQSAGIRQTLPPVSYVKAIDIWMCVCLLFVFAALLEFAYVNVLMRRPTKKSKTEPDGPASNDTNKTQDEFDKIEVKPTTPENKSKFLKLKERFLPTAQENRSKALQIDNLAKLLFPATFVLFIAIFFIVCFAARVRDFDD
ncbi:Glycine receptor subunit alpha-3 [Mactra antiquata]